MRRCSLEQHTPVMDVHHNGALCEGLRVGCSMLVQERHTHVPVSPVRFQKALQQRVRPVTMQEVRDALKEGLLNREASSRAKAEFIRSGRRMSSLIPDDAPSPTSAAFFDYADAPFTTSPVIVDEPSPAFTFTISSASDVPSNVIPPPPPLARLFSHDHGRSLSRPLTAPYSVSTSQVQRLRWTSWRFFNAQRGHSPPIGPEPFPAP